MKISGAILSLMLIGAQADAETPSEGVLTSLRVLTLGDAIRTAIQYNWDLRSAKNDLDAAAAQKVAAVEFPNPALSISTIRIPIDSASTLPASDNSIWGRGYDSTASINQLFEIGGKRTSRRESADAAIKGAEARLQNARRLLELSVAKSYIGALLAEANVAILLQSADSLRKEAMIAERRYKAGDISLSDKTQIDIAASRFELDAEAAKSSAVIARIAVENLMGTTSPAGEWRAEESLDDLAGQLAPGSEGPEEPSRPDIAAAEASLKKAEADLKLQKAMRIPDPTLFFQYEHAPPDQPNTVGLGVSIPFPLWNRNQGNISASEADRSQAKLQLGKNRAQVALEIANARIAWRHSRERSRRYREEILPRSADVLKTVTFAYEKGGASLLDLLLAERSDNEVRLATAQAAADAAGAAADLRTALNSPVEEKSKP